MLGNCVTNIIFEFICLALYIKYFKIKIGKLANDSIYNPSKILAKKVIYLVI